MTETVTVGFSAPGTIEVDVENPNDVDEILAAVAERIDSMDTAELLEILHVDMVTENIHYVDGSDGEIYHEW